MHSKKIHLKYTIPFLLTGGLLTGCGSSDAYIDEGINPGYPAGVDRIDAAGVDTTTEIDTLVAADTAQALIEAYAADKTNPAPSVQDYADAGVTDLNIDAINEAIATTDAAGVDTTTEIQDLIAEAIIELNKSSIKRADYSFGAEDSNATAIPTENTPADNQLIVTFTHDMDPDTLTPDAILVDGVALDPILTAVYDDIARTYTITNVAINTTAGSESNISTEDTVRLANGSAPVAGFGSNLVNPRTDIADTYDSAITYISVASPDNEGVYWLDRNLGATSNDPSVKESYGSLFQWGRPADGHQLVTYSSESVGETDTATTNTLATSIAPGDDTLFITQGYSPYDWVANDVDNNGSLRMAAWSKTDGTSICPVGYRVPMEAEYAADTTDTTITITNRDIARTSFLHMPAPGYRDSVNDAIYYEGASGSYWTSEASGSNAREPFFYETVAYIRDFKRAYGRSVRCFKD